MKFNFDGFTEKANTALNYAISDAGQMGHTYVGSEHLLLGLLKTGSGVAAMGASKENIDWQKARRKRSYRFRHFWRQ